MLDKCVFIAHSKIFTLIKDINQNDFSKQLENIFGTSISLNQSKNLALYDKSNICLTCNFEKRFCISDSCQAFQKPKNFECLKTGLNTMPFASYM